MIDLHGKLEFNETFHIYSLDGVVLSNVTSLLSKHGLAPDFSGVAPDILEKAAAKGRLIHEAIENFVTTGERSFIPEVQMIEDYFKEHEITPVHTEIKVYKDNLAGTIDMEAIQGDKTLLIDWKTGSVIDETYIAWQLSLYNYLIDDNVKREFLCLQPREDGLKEYRIKEVPLKNIKQLLECEENGTLYSDIQRVWKEDEIEELTELAKKVEELTAELKAEEAKLNKKRDALTKQMADLRVKTFSGEKVRVTYVAPSVRQKTNLDKLRTEYPEVAEKVISQSKIKGYVKVKYMGGADEE